MKVWKLFWDIFAVVVGAYLGYKTFLFSGERIETFGYFPIGVMLGLVVLGIGAMVTHLLEGLLASLLFKIFKIRMEEKLPFE